VFLELLEVFVLFSELSLELQKLLLLSLLDSVILVGLLSFVESITARIN
jgi:hypothetical protein